MLKRSLCALCCLLPASCATEGGGPAGFVLLDPNHHVAGAMALDGTANGQCLSNPAYVVGIVSRGNAPRGLPWACYDLFYNLRLARDHAVPSDPRSQAVAVVRALIAVSESSCYSYRNFLTQFHGNVQTTFGISSQLAAIIATLAGHGAAPWFAGAAAGLGGAGGSLNSAYFYDQTLPTITAAFEKRRSDELTTINQKLDGTAKYDFADALVDAEDYHSQCSLGAGLEELKDSLKESSSPSLDTLKTYLSQQKEARDAMRDFIKNEATADAAATKDQPPPPPAGMKNCPDGTVVAAAATCPAAPPAPAPARAPVSQQSAAAKVDPG